MKLMSLLKLLRWSAFALMINAIMCSSPLSSFKDAGCNYDHTSRDFNATYVLGALFPIHHLKTSAAKYFLNVFGVMWVEAFLFAIDEINKDQSLLPGIKLGYDVRDTCDSEQVAKKHSLDFISDGKYFPFVSNLFEENESDSDEGSCRCVNGSKSKLLGVVGGARSTVSSMCSYLLGFDSIPQISYASTSPSLSQKFLYPNFLRTIPSDFQQIVAMAELLRYMNWTYVSVLASDDEYGQKAIELLQKEFRSRDICLAVQNQFNPSLPDNELEGIVDALQETHEKSQVVILWATQSNVIYKIMYGCINRGLQNMIWGIMTESLTANFNIMRFPNHRVIRLRHDRPPVENFAHHMNNMAYQSHLQNTWMRSLWESFGFCPERGPVEKICINSKPNGGILIKTKHETVIASVYAFAHGLHSYLNCTSKSCHRQKTIHYKELLHEIANVRFQVPSSRFTVAFDDEGDIDGNASYQFVLNGLISEIDFGHSNDKDQTIKINEKTFWDHYGRNRSKLLRATCSYSCRPGFYRVQRSQSCCWNCIQCPSGEISSMIDSKSCSKCGILERPNKHHNKCLPLRNFRLELTSGPGLILCILSLIGVCFAFSVLILFMIFWNTPVVKSANRELSLFQITCMIILFILPVTHFVQISIAACILKTVVFGSLHSLILAMVLLKTYRLWRIFQPRFFARHMRMFLKVPVQMFSAFLLVFVLLLGLALWYIVHKPQVNVYVDQAEFGFVYYCGTEESYLMYGFVVYIILLSLASGFIAFRARNLPSNFNEAQCIWLAMFANCITWITLLPLHLSLSELHKPVVILSINFASNFVLLVILYGPKIRILLCLSHLNDQSEFVLSSNASVRTFTLKISGSEQMDEDDTSSGKKSIMLKRNRVISFNFSNSTKI